jgi:hypothetical protein
MAEDTSKVPFERITELFAEAGVEFIVFGTSPDTSDFVADALQTGADQAAGSLSS